MTRKQHNKIKLKYFVMSLSKLFWLVFLVKGGNSLVDLDEDMLDSILITEADGEESLTVDNEMFNFLVSGQIIAGKNSYS